MQRNAGQKYAQLSVISIAQLLHSEDKIYFSISDFIQMLILVLKGRSLGCKRLSDWEKPYV